MAGIEEGAGYCSTVKTKLDGTTLEEFEFDKVEGRVGWGW
jgi:hypothetical protein